MENIIVIVLVAIVVGFVLLITSNRRSQSSMNSTIKTLKDTMISMQDESRRTLLQFQEENRQMNAQLSKRIDSQELIIKTMEYEMQGLKRQLGIAEHVLKKTKVSHLSQVN